MSSMPPGKAETAGPGQPSSPSARLPSGQPRFAVGCALEDAELPPWPLPTQCQ